MLQALLEYCCREGNGGPYLKNKPWMSLSAFILAKVHGFLPPTPNCPPRLLTPDSANTAELYIPDCLSRREGCVSLSGVMHGKHP